MPSQKLKKESGFTLMEVIIALGISFWIATMVILVTVGGLRNIRTMKTWESLHSNALFLTDVITYWVKQADQLEITSPSQLQITLPNYSVKLIEKTADKITIDGGELIDDDVQVTELNFTHMERSVRINFTLKGENSNEIITVNTTVAQRNTL